MRVKESIALAVTAFEMPQGCYSCPFCVAYGKNHTSIYCALKKCESRNDVVCYNPSIQRASYCPLIECTFTAKDEFMDRSELIEAIKNAINDMS